MYVLVWSPPANVKFIAPVLAPLHILSTCVPLTSIACVGPSTVTLVSAVHPLTSFTVTAYVPAINVHESVLE